jgi:hypothetical protein
MLDVMQSGEDAGSVKRMRVGQVQYLNERESTRACHFQVTLILVSSRDNHALDKHSHWIACSFIIKASRGG